MTKKDELEALLTEFAYAGNQYLKDTGCVREADNVDPVWASSADICEAIGVPIGYWPAIIARMDELDMHVGLAYFGGFYIGKEGEEVTRVKHTTSVIRGLMRKLNDDITRYGRNGSEGLDQLRKRSGELFGREIDLTNIPKICRAHGIPLNPQVEIALIEAAKHTADE